MKIVKTLVLLILVALSHEFLIKRVERKTANKSMGDGSGSWKTGYECPGISLRESEGTDWTTPERVSFKALQVVEPEDSEKLGVYFTLTAKPSTVLNTILKPTNKENTYYLPYRSVSSSFSYNNPKLDYKVFIASVTSDDNKTYSFKLKLPYKKLLWYINDNEMQKLCDTINDNRTGRQSIVNTSKSIATKASGNYILNKQLLENATSESNDLKKLKELANGKKAALSTQIDFMTNNIEILKREIDEMEAVLIKKKTQYKLDNNNLNSLGAQIQGIDQNINNLNNDSKTKDDLKTGLEKIVNKSSTDFKAALEVLAKEVPEKAQVFEEVKTDVLDKKSDDKLKSTLQNIFS